MIVQLGAPVLAVLAGARIMGALGMVGLSSPVPRSLLEVSYALQSFYLQQRHYSCPPLVTMQVLKQQGRWPGAGGVYGGYPVSRVDARRRYESVRARHEDESYRRVAKGGAARMRRCAAWRFSRASRLFFWVWGRSRCVRAAATGKLFSCRACWSLLVLPCFMLLGVWDAPDR